MPHELSRHSPKTAVNVSTATLESRSLLAFIAVAEELHFGRAARRLHISQPPLSQQIRRFESEIGCELFVRTTRTVQLTPAGKVLLKKARQLVEYGQTAIMAARRAAIGETGSVTIGFTSTAAYQLLPRLLAGYRTHSPEVELTLYEDVSTTLIEHLLANKIDIALLRRPASAEHRPLLFRRVSQENMCLAMPAGHEFSQQEQVAVSQLHGIPLVGYSALTALYFRERLEKLFAHYNVQPKIIYESAMPTLLALVESGVGVAIVPESAASMRPTTVSYRPLAAAGGLAAIDLYYARRKDDLNPAMALLDEVFQET
jgi:DNA-binding transcriptional LysR family regulator